MDRLLRTRYSAADRRRQIMDVAVKLFARQGFNGTTTRQVAQAAGVTEALIFRHFPSKEDLYWAVIDSKCSAVGQRELQRRLASGGDDRQVFTAIAEDIVRRRSQDPGLIRLLLFTGLEHHRLSDRFFRTHVARYYQMLAQHIRRRIACGAFRRVEPLLAARGFLGMIGHYLMMQELFGAGLHQKLPAREAVAVLTDIWLEGMRQRPGRPLHRNGSNGTHKNGRNGNRS